MAVSLSASRLTVNRFAHLLAGSRYRAFVTPYVHSARRDNRLSLLFEAGQMPDVDDLRHRLRLAQRSGQGERWRPRAALRPDQLPHDPRY
jgi:hypothetical protein